MSLFKPTFWQIPLVSLDVQDHLAEKTAKEPDGLFGDKKVG